MAIKTSSNSKTKSKAHSKSSSSSSSSSKTKTKADAGRNVIYRYKLNAFGEECVKPVPRWTAAETQQLERLVEQVSVRQQLASPHELFGRKGEPNISSKNRNDGEPAPSSIWFEIAREFRHRQVEAVYKKALRTFQNKNRTRGPWTQDETLRLHDLVALHGKCWSKIGILINRTSDSCSDKYRETKQDYARGAWTDEEMDKLMALVAEYRSQLYQSSNTKYDNNDDYVGDGTTGGLPWTTISTRMQTRSRLQCFYRWQEITAKATNEKQQNTNAETTRDKPSTLTSMMMTERQSAGSIEEQQSVDMDSASLSSFSRPPLQMEKLYASLERLCIEHYQKNNLNVVTTRDILQALQEEFGSVKFDKKTRTLLKQRLKDQLASFDDRNNASSDAAQGNETRKRQQPTASAKSGTKKRKRMRQTSNDDTRDDQVQVDSPPESNGKKNQPHHPPPTTTTETSSFPAPTRPTLYDVAKAMKKTLKKAPDRRLKEKSLRRALKAKFKHDQKTKSSKHVKKYMKQILLASNNNNGSSKQKFKVDGKMVSLV